MISTSKLFTIVVFSTFMIFSSINSVIASSNNNNCNEYNTSTSPEYKFEIDYPASINPQNDLNDDPPHVFFMEFRGECDANSMNLLIYPDDQTLQQFIDKEMTKTSGTGEKTMLKAPSPITIAGDNQGLEFSYTTFNGIVLTKNIVFSHDDRIYYLWYMDETSGFNNEGYERVVNSIKFFD